MSQDRNITVIGIEMVAAGLPSAFVLRVLELAMDSEGIADLVHLWDQAPDERPEIEADLHGAIEDREPAEPPGHIDSAWDADVLLEQRRRQKAHLRRLVEERGGVSGVARKADMPQPSLSRLLNSMSEPRPATMKRLAEAMEVPVAALSPDPESDVEPPDRALQAVRDGLPHVRQGGESCSENGRRVKTYRLTLTDADGIVLGQYTFDVDPTTPDREAFRQRLLICKSVTASLNEGGLTDDIAHDVAVDIVK